MTQDGAESGARTRIEASEVGGRWYVRYVDTQFWGDGESLSAAHEDLRRREADYKAYLEKVGVPVLPVTGLKRWLHGAARPAGRLLLALAVFSLFMVPVSYAISSGIGRGIKESEFKIGGREFWKGLEQRLIEFSEEKHDLPPEKVEALQKAVHRIVLRVRPFTSELKQIFEPVDERPAAEKQ